MRLSECISAMLIGAALAGFPAIAQASSGTDAITRDIIVEPEQEPLYTLEVPESDMDVTAWVDRPDHTYRPGDTVTLYVKTNQPAYLYVINHGTSGKIHLIYPNRYQKRQKVPAHRVVQIPSEDAKFRLRVGGPAGTELIKVIATSEPDPLIAQRYLRAAGPVQVYRGTAQALTRDIIVELNPPEVEVGVEVETKERPESAVEEVVLRIEDERASLDPASTGAMAEGAASPAFTPDEMYRRGVAAAFWGLGEPDYTTARDWFRRAADQGHAKAMYRLGWLSENGFGIDRDMTAARAWYRKAADLGYPVAMTHLARLLLDGRGGARDYAQGRRWLKRAADAGEGAAMASLAGVYDRGLGVAPDARVAARMALGALRRGHWRLQEYLGEFSPDTRREIQERLRVAGYYDGKIDGVIGPRTQAALVDYALAG